MPFRLLTLWLQLGLVGSIAMAFVLLFAPWSSIMEAYNATYAQAFYEGVALSPAERAHHGFLMGVSGAGVVGWAITLLFVVEVPWKRREPWAFVAVLVSVLAWVLLDLVISLVEGVHGEALFAGAAGFGLLTPVLLSAPHFRRSQKG